MRILCSNGKIYPSQGQAARELGITQSAIAHVLIGICGHVAGYTFKKVKEVKKVKGCGNDTH